MPEPWNWTKSVVGQLEFYWDAHLWPRLRGLTDDEYLWEPLPDCWSIRPGPDGRWTADAAPADAIPTEQLAPFTTIAWRMAHISVGCFATRVSTFFGDGTIPDDADMFDERHKPASLPPTAVDGLDDLEETYRRWHDAISVLDAQQLLTPLGPKGSWFANDPMAELILHINREVMHHGGEIGVLRDLYAHRIG
jgi:DinB superfamily